MKKQDTIGKTIKNAKIAYGCKYVMNINIKNSLINKLLSYQLLQKFTSRADSIL